MLSPHYNLLFAMIFSFLLTVISADPRPETAQLRPNDNRIDVAWHDAEDDLRGTVTPRRIRVGVSIVVSIRVEPFNLKGARPSALAMTLRQVPFVTPQEYQPISPGNIDQEDPGTVVQMQLQTDGSYLGEVTPTRDGPHVLQFSFRSTRMKNARAAINVESAPLPLWPWLLAASLFVALPLWMVARKKVP
jgi:hypothetical protein